MKILIATIVFILIHISVHSQSLRDEISIEEKLFGLSKIWSEVTYNYAFMDKITFDIDSLYKSLIPKAIEARDNEEYILVLKEFLYSFKNNKTGVWNSQWYWDEVDKPPIEIEVKDRTFLVERIAMELSERIPIGSQLIAVDGKKPTNNLIGPRLSAVAIDIVTPKGDTIQTALLRNSNYKWKYGKEYEMIPSRTYDSFIKFNYELKDGYSIVTLNTFSDSLVVDEFRSKLSKINNNKGLIIDVTNNGGGDDENAKGIAKHLVERDFLVGPSWKTRVNNAARKAFGASQPQRHETDPRVSENQDYYKNIAYQTYPPDTTQISRDIYKIKVPIIILQSKQTVSAAEDFLIFSMGNENIRRVGQSSAGNSGQPLKFTLSNGVPISILAKRDALPNGEDYIGLGIKPDLETDPEINQVEYAIKLLKQK